MARILVVEDDEELLNGLVVVLSRQDEVLIATDVPGALAQLDAGPVDLVLLDMILPRGTGFHVLDHLQRRTGARPPVIVMSALVDELDLTPYAGLVAETLPKPFRLERVMQKVRSVLAGHRSLREGSVDAPVSATVLLVDDDRELREGMGDYLRHLGYRVRTASRAEEALELLDREEFDVVVSDWIMPGTTGMGLMEQLRAACPHLPVLLVTAHGTPDFTRHALRAGASDVLLKPFPPKALPAAIDKCLRQTGERPATEPEALDLAEQERTAIIRALERAGGNKVQAAKLLGISRAGLYIKLKVYDLQ